MIPPVARVSGFAATARIMVRSDQLEIVMRRLIALQAPKDLCLQQMSAC